MQHRTEDLDNGFGQTMRRATRGRSYAAVPVETTQRSQPRRKEAPYYKFLRELDKQRVDGDKR